MTRVAKDASYMGCGVGTIPQGEKLEELSS